MLPYPKRLQDVGTRINHAGAIVIGPSVARPDFGAAAALARRDVGSGPRWLSRVCAMTTVTSNEGTVAAVRGSVIDVTFPERIPAIYHVLKSGPAQEIVMEVVSHLDATTVRSIALTPTRGLWRGAPRGRHAPNPRSAGRRARARARVRCVRPNHRPQGPR